MSATAPPAQTISVTTAALSDCSVSLSALQAANAGLLSAIFGRDGSAEDAPGFTGPVFADGEWWHVLCLSGSEGQIGEVLCSRLFSWPVSGRVFPLSSVVLRLDVPTVAARVGGACAQALATRTIASEADCRLCAEGMMSPMGIWTQERAIQLVALLFSLADSVAALRDSR